LAACQPLHPLLIHHWQDVDVLAYHASWSLASLYCQTSPIAEHSMPCTMRGLHAYARRTRQHTSAFCPRAVARRASWGRRHPCLSLLMGLATSSLTARLSPANVAGLMPTALHLPSLVQEMRAPLPRQW
jgi:hypothetical protein